MQALGADQVLTRALDLVRYASDASPYRMIPKAVVEAPRRRRRRGADAARVRARTPLVFRAGGTSLNGQAPDRFDPRRRPPSLAARADRGAGALARAFSRASTLGLANRLLGAPRPPARPRPGEHPDRVRRRRGRQQLGRDAVRNRRRLLPDGPLDEARARQRHRDRHRGAGRRAALRARRPRARGRARPRSATRSALTPSSPQRIARKFEIKNTTGYRLCAFLDADTPLEIFRRLVVGSEGTLAFLAEAVFETVPLGRHATRRPDRFRGSRQRRRRGRRAGRGGRDGDRTDGRADADRGRLQHAGHAGGVEGAAADLGRAAGRVPCRRARRARSSPSARRSRSSRAGR